MARIRRLIMLIAVITLGAALSAAPASAHTDLTGSDPDDGARLTSPPAAITLTFTEDMSPRLATVTLQVGTTDAGEMDVRQGETTNALVAEVPLDRILAGGSPQTWTVSYRVTSTDGHPVEGTLTFQAPTPAQLPAAPTPTPSSEPSSNDVPATDEQSANSGAGTSSALVAAALAGIAIAVVLVLRARRRSDQK
ncbi:copper resistance CopC family protein [Nocardioides caricicola]|uniref:Copper resistance protein CopC n=2 Tax=Nocardioides caricicola TaxID=634770 RepID=A0ABW0N1W9_9ACTN